jgi:hypothetical protein
MQKKFDDIKAEVKETEVKIYRLHVGTSHGRK